MGAGHDSAAAALTAQAEADGYEVLTVDLLSMPKLRQGDALRVFYHGMIAVAPGLYDWAMRTWLHRPALFEWITRNGGRSSEQPLLDVAAEFRADAVVAVYNLAAQVLGRLRSDGRLTIPVATYVTDPGAHPYWIWPGVDLHLAPMPGTAAALEDMGAEAVKPVAPLIAANYVEPVDRAEARRRWNVEPAAKVVLVNGGSWGVGHVVAAAKRLTEVADVVLVLTGRSGRLKSRLAAIDKVRAVPWTSRRRRSARGGRCRRRQRRRHDLLGSARDGQAHRRLPADRRPRPDQRRRPRADRARHLHDLRCRAA